MLQENLFKKYFDNFKRLFFILVLLVFPLITFAVPLKTLPAGIWKVKVVDKKELDNSCASFLEATDRSIEYFKSFINNSKSDDWKPEDAKYMLGEKQRGKEMLEEWCSSHYNKVKILESYSLESYSGDKFLNRYAELPIDNLKAGDTFWIIAGSMSAPEQCLNCLEVSGLIIKYNDLGIFLLSVVMLIIGWIKKIKLVKYLGLILFLFVLFYTGFSVSTLIYLIYFVFAIVWIVPLWLVVSIILLILIFLISSKIFKFRKRNKDA
jgi:hypothetical protein